MFDWYFYFLSTFNLVEIFVYAWIDPNLLFIFIGQNLEAIFNSKGF